MKNLSLKAVGVAIGLMAAPLLQAMPFEASATNADAMVERIEVYGKKTTAQLEHIVMDAKVDFYETFNDYNDDPEFRIQCRAEAIVGSNIKRKVCRANYVAEAWYRFTQEANWGGDISWRMLQNYISSVERIDFTVRDKHKQAEKKMVDIAMEHPEVMESLQRYMAAYSTLAQREN